MKLDYVSGWAVNVLIVAVLPTRMGLSGAPLWMFLAYAVTAGIALTLAEDLRYARLVLTRSDVRSYLKVRVSIVGVGGIVPFLLGSGFS